MQQEIRGYISFKWRSAYSREVADILQLKLAKFGLRRQRGRHCLPLILFFASLKLTGSANAFDECLGDVLTSLLPVEFPSVNNELRSFGVP